MQAAIYHGPGKLVGNLFLTHHEKEKIEANCGHRLFASMIQEENGQIQFSIKPATIGSQRAQGVQIIRSPENAEPEHPWRLAWTLNETDHSIPPFGKTHAEMIEINTGLIKGLVADPRPLKNRVVPLKPKPALIAAASKAPTIPQLRAAVETVNLALKADRNIAVVLDGRVVRLSMNI